MTTIPRSTISQGARAAIMAVLLLTSAHAQASAAIPLAESHLNYAVDLGSRGAVYSAQAEFTQVLQIAAQALDTQAGVQDHATALNVGLAALAEADDFSPSAQRDGTMDLARRIATHRTPVLKNSNLERLTPLVAMQVYYDYGKQQLARSAGHDPLASAALYGLARLQTVIGGRNSGPKAVALHQAALVVNPNNHLAANELGVLLFRYGQANDARGVLLHSVRVVPRSETWHNLAVVCADLGHTDEAQSARKNCEEALAAERAAGPKANGGAGKVYWVDKEKLTSMPAEASWDASGNSAVTKAFAPAADTSKKNERSFSSLLPWSAKETK